LGAISGDLKEEEEEEEEAEEEEGFKMFQM